MTHEQFYEGLPHFESHPTASVPGPGQFVKAYEQLARAGATEIVSVHVSSVLSAMVGVARLAAQDVDSVPVTVFDSGKLTLGTGLRVLTAARAAAEGRPLSDIIATLEDQASRTYGIAALDTLDYLQRSGRLSRIQSGLGSVAVTSIYGAQGGLATEGEIAASRPLLPADSRWRAIEGGKHAQFGWCGPKAGDGIAMISREEQQRQIVAATLELCSRLAAPGS